ncbi:MAG TPA: tRNA pseudouridine(38-40) synthase TruA [Candidatus Dormibacteraeota bacterium]|nr:tRNA pseudouridine(38-40) synthase TruA [Candidatus Dormibacteraeota bacterium]
MRNIRLLLEYDGAGFAGWQLQVGHRTIEAELRRAVRDITGEQVKLYAAGRTDAGAHAEGQVANFHYAGRLSTARLAAALNARLPPDVAVLRADEAAPDFHARYSARWRRYRYRFLDRPARPALDRGRCWHLPGPLDVDAMADAARALVGRHDWTTFCAASEPAADRVRTIHEARAGRHDRFVELELLGEGFLRGLVRGIAGGLAEVGRGRRPARWLGEVLATRDRRLAPKTAPADGLTLMEVLYEE